MLLLAAWLSSSACSPGQSDLFVELKTDLVPAAEFTRIRTIVRPSDGATAGREQDNPAMAGGDYLMGVRVAELGDLPPDDYTVRVELFGADGRQFIERSVRVNFRQSSGVTVIITRNCRGVVCPGDTTSVTLTECLGGRCVSPECAQGDEESCGDPQCSDAGDCVTPADCAAAICDDGICFARPLVDGCPTDQYCDAAVGCVDLPTATDAGMPDGGDAGGCTMDAECDDGIECTVDSCDAGVCVVATDDSVCTDGSGGACIDGFGCQYDGCSPATCVAGPCETARCDGETCTIESDCEATEMCCGDSCVAIGCDDGDPCTDDSCGGAGCDNTPNSAPCEDGTFCNGADTCGGGTCSVHAGDPCSAGTTCDEGVSSCVGCVDDGDCPTDIIGVWGACEGFSGTCDETGTQMRTRTSFSCSGGTCVRSDMGETGSCGRTTTGVTCGMTTFGTWGACGGYSGTCGEAGTRSRTRTDRVCGGGMCGDEMSTDMGSCARDTDGAGCGTTTYGPWGSCGGFADVCDQTGMRSRSQMEFSCAGGSCNSVPGTDSESCSRTTNGTTCGMTTYGAWGTCGSYGSVCGETGSRSRSQTDRVCASGSCSSEVGSDTGSCMRDTEGNSCDDFPSCRRGTCAVGSCNLIGSGCSGGQRCCEPGICVCTACECP